MEIHQKQVKFKVGPRPSSAGTELKKAGIYEVRFHACKIDRTQWSVIETFWMVGNSPSCGVMFCLSNTTTLTGGQTFGHLSGRENPFVSCFYCEIDGIDGQTVAEYGDLCSRGKEELRAGFSLCNCPRDMAFRSCKLCLLAEPVYG